MSQWENAVRVTWVSWLMKLIVQANDTLWPIQCQGCVQLQISAYYIHLREDFSTYYTRVVKRPHFYKNLVIATFVLISPQLLKSFCCIIEYPLHLWCSFVQKKNIVWIHKMQLCEIIRLRVILFFDKFTSHKNIELEEFSSYFYYL